MPTSILSIGDNLCERSLREDGTFSSIYIHPTGSMYAVRISTFCGCTTAPNFPTLHYNALDTGGQIGGKQSLRRMGRL
jgi:hypothetical protein